MRKLALVLAGVLMLELVVPTTASYAAPMYAKEIVLDETEIPEETFEYDMLEDIMVETNENDIEDNYSDTIYQESISGNILDNENTTIEVETTDEFETIDEMESTEESNESLSEELIETPLECFEWNETTIIKYIGSDPNVVIPKDATTIGANAFKDNKVIESVVINEDRTS